MPLDVTTDSEIGNVHIVCVCVGGGGACVRACVRAWVRLCEYVYTSVCAFVCACPCV